MNDYRDDLAVLRRARLEIAVDAFDRVGRAERLLERRRLELQTAMHYLNDEDLAEYARQTNEIIRLREGAS